MCNGVTLKIAKGQGLLSALLNVVKTEQANGNISGEYNYNKIVNCNMWDKLKEINDARKANGEKTIYHSNDYTCSNRSDEKGADYWQKHMVVYAGDIKLTDSEWNALVTSMGLELTSTSSTQQQNNDQVQNTSVNTEVPVTKRHPVREDQEANGSDKNNKPGASTVQQNNVQNKPDNTKVQQNNAPTPVTGNRTNEQILNDKLKETWGNDVSKLERLGITTALNNDGNVEYRASNGTLLDAQNIKQTVATMEAKQEATTTQAGNMAMKPADAESTNKPASQPVTHTRTTTFNADTEVEDDAKGVVEQRVKMNDEKFNTLIGIPNDTKTAEKTIKDSYVDKQSSQATSEDNFANAVLQYKYSGDDKDLDALADFLIESGLSAEEIRKRYGIKAEFTDESMVDGDKVSQGFKNMLKQEFLEGQKPVKDRTMDEMAESLTNVTVDGENKLQVEPAPLDIGLPELKDIDLTIPEVLTQENINKYNTNLGILKKSPSGENVLDVMEHNRNGEKRAIEIPATLERSTLSGLTVDKVKEVKLDEVDQKFNTYASIKLDGLTGVQKRKSLQQQTDLKKELAQQMGISDNDIDYSKVDINDLKAVRDTEKVIQDREKAKVAISEVTKSMGDKNFPTADDVQEKVSDIDANILAKVNEALPQAEDRIAKANADIVANNAKITELQALINDKKKQLTEQARESSDAKSQRNELKETIAKLEQQILDLRLANAHIQENLNMLNAIKAKLNNVKTASVNARNLLASCKSALDGLQAFDQKSAPVEDEKIKKQDKKAQKRFDKHNKRATKDIKSDKVLNENRRKASNKKLDKYNTVEEVKVKTDNSKLVEDIQAKFINKETQQ